MSLRRLRIGELVGLAGSICVIVALTRRWYESPIGDLDAWNTFGPCIVLLLAALCASLAMVVSALTERSPALPVSTAVWCVPLGLAGVIAAVVRVLERPDHATSLCSGVWLALVGSVGILVGAWLALRDERPSLYQPATPEPRPRP
jgi:drug/metabolite transporter (DMT)-like permease